MCYDAGSFGGPSSVMILHSMAPSAQLNYAFRSFKNRPNRTYFVQMQSHVSAGSYMSYDARSFAGPSSVMILNSMAPSAHMNYAACSGTVPPAAAWAFIFRRDTETEGTRKWFLLVQINACSFRQTRMNRWGLLADKRIMEGGLVINDPKTALFSM